MSSIIGCGNTRTIKVQALESDWLVVNSTGADHTEVPDHIDSKMQGRLHAYHFQDDICTTAIRKLLDLGWHVLVCEMESLVCSMALRLFQTIGNLVDGIDILPFQFG